MAVPLATAIRSEVRYIQRRIAELQSGWPKGLSLSLNALPSVYDFYPYLFLGAFPSLEPSDIRNFALASRLFASAIFLLDKVLDAEEVLGFGEEDKAQSVLRIVALQWEAMRLLSEEFDARSRFWDHFRTYLAEHMDACLLENRLRKGEDSWNEIESKLHKVAIGKNGVARTAVAGLAEMAQDYKHFEILIDSVNKYNWANQLLDDLVDWKDDFRQRRLTLLLYWATQSSPLEWDQIEESALSRKIYYGGAALSTLQLAIEALQDARRAISGLPDLAWSEVLAGLHDRIFSLKTDIEDMVHKNLYAIKERASLKVFPPTFQNAWQEMAWRGLAFIIRQWKRGFGDLMHYMGFPKDTGLVEKYDIYSGDVFQRAVVTEMLCKANKQWLGGQLDILLEQEVAYLIKQRHKQGVGGWKYFPKLATLPPDADTLAQVMQVFLCVGKTTPIREFCLPPLEILFRDGIHEDGSFETWIIPAKERTLEQEAQRAAARSAWGEGPDPDVMANVLYAIALYDARKFQEVIQRGIRYLEKQQTAEGYWKSTWYIGPYYGTYVVTRLLAWHSPDSERLTKSLEFLYSTQHPDGGWGHDRRNTGSDALSTSLALLSLANLRPPREDVDRIKKGFKFLQRNQQDDGGWDKEAFIRMDLGRARGQPNQWILTYGSRTITTSFAVKALLAWNFLLEDQID